MLRPLRPVSRAAVVAAVAVATLLTPAVARADVSPTTPAPTTTAPTGSATSATSPATSAPTTTAPAASSATATTTSPATATATSPTTAPATATSSTSTEPAPTSQRGRLVSGGTDRVFGLAAAAATSPAPDQYAAGYLAAELAKGGHHFSVTFSGVDYADYGVTADAVLALDAAGASQTEATAATKYLADNVVNYTGFGDPTEIAAGSVSKLLNVALAQGIDPTAFGGFDLLGTLQSLEQPSGQFRDVSKYPKADGSYGDYSNVFGQSLALMGLKRAGVDPSTASVDFLLAQQCTDGGFRLDFGVSPCASDPDATAMAVQALIAADGTAQPAAGRGLDYLAGKQAADGGVGGGGPTAATNANSTGLAGQAFLAGGRTAQARAAVEYLTALQYGCQFPAGLRGGVAYASDSYAEQLAAGAGAVPSDQDRRSTTQAALALAGTPLYAVTAVGAAATAPTLTCTSTPTGTTTTTTGTSTTTAAPGGHSTTTPPAGTVVPVATGALAYTGSHVTPLLWLALLLVLGGATALVSTRRRGAHS